MEIVKDFTSFWLGMFDIKSKTSRKSYWLTILSLVIMFLVISQVSSLLIKILFTFVFRIIGFNDVYIAIVAIPYIMQMFCFCSCIIPFLSLSLRRINDLGLNRLYIIYALIPPAFLILMCLEGKKDNEDIIL